MDQSLLGFFRSEVRSFEEQFHAGRTADALLLAAGLSRRPELRDALAQALRTCAREFRKLFSMSWNFEPALPENMSGGIRLLYGITGMTSSRANAEERRSKLADEMERSIFAGQPWFALVDEIYEPIIRGALFHELKDEASANAWVARALAQIDAAADAIASGWNADSPHDQTFLPIGSADYGIYSLRFLLASEETDVNATIADLIHLLEGATNPIRAYGNSVGDVG